MTLLLHGAHTSIEAPDRTPNPGLVDDEPMPDRLVFRAPMLIPAGVCGSCDGLVDTNAHCACSR